MGFFWVGTIIHARHSPSRAGHNSVGAPLALIAVSAALELPLNLLGHHFLIENFINSVAAPFMAASLSPISPVATFLVILPLSACFCGTSCQKNIPGTSTNRIS